MPIGFHGLAPLTIHFLSTKTGDMNIPYVMRYEHIDMGVELRTYLML